jgi:hypothetical protein
MTSLLDQFRGAKVPGAFNADTPVGATVHGEVLDVDVVQATEYTKDGKPGAPLFHPDGKPKLQYVITIQTELKGPDDDGKRKIYVKMWYKSDREALLAAVEAAGDDDVRKGGQFAAQFLGKLNGEAWNTCKYEYRKPSNLAAAGGSILDTPAPAAPTVTVASQPALPTPPVAAPAAPTTPNDAATVRALIAAGLDDDTITAAVPGVKRELIQALRNVAG